MRLHTVQHGTYLAWSLQCSMSLNPRRYMNASYELCKEYSNKFLQICSIPARFRPFPLILRHIPRRSPMRTMHPRIAKSVFLRGEEKTLEHKSLESVRV